MSLSTTLSMFFASKNLYICMSFDIIDFLDITICEKINKKQIINIFKATQLS